MMFPEILRIGGNDTDGLSSIQVRKDKVVVVNYPTGIPTPDDEQQLLVLDDTPWNRIEICDKWDELNQRQMLSHIGEDVAVFEEGELLDLQED